MNLFSGILTRVTVICFAGASALCAEPSPRDLEGITQAAQKTRARLLEQPARWVVRFLLTPENAIVARVVVDGSRRSEVFTFESAEQKLPLLRIVERDDVWYVEQNGERQKYR